MGGVEYQVTKVDPTNPETKGMVYQVHKVTEEVAATLGGKVYRARIIKDPTEPTVAGKVYQIVLIGDPSDPAVKGKVYNAILTGGSEAVVIGPAVSPLELPDAVAGELNYVKAYGGLEQNGTPTPTSPVDIVCNNGVLKVKDSELPVGYRRLQDITTNGDVKYESQVRLTGNDTLKFSFKSAAGNLLGSITAVDADNNYSFYSTTSSTGKYARYNGQTGGSSILSGTRYDVIMSPTGVTGIRNPSSFTPREFTCSNPFYIFTTSSNNASISNATIYGSIEVSGTNNGKFIPAERVSDGEIGYFDTIKNVFLENQGSGTPTTSGYDTSYMTEVYVDGTVETIEDTIGNTATCEPLLAVGDYADVQEILSGAITRRVGVKVLDGTENWIAGSVSGIWVLAIWDTVWTPGNAMALYSTHYVGTAALNASMPMNSIKITGSSALQKAGVFIKTEYTDLADFKSFLAEQYAAGTPVIVVYPLAEPTTESVAGQTLQVQAGDNTLEITQASMSGLKLEAEYGKEAE